MKRFLGTISLAALFAAGLPLALFIHCSPGSAKDRAVAGLLSVKKQVETQLKNRADGLAGQVAAFSRVIAVDRDFSMKVLVDKDRSAPEVTELAPRYMEPMALSMLSIVNNHDTILSCGQFPASAGGPSSAAALPDSAFCFVMDNVKGRAVLTLQSRARFTILDAAFYAIGGVVVDDKFCAALVLPPGYRLFCKQGGAVIGMENVESISDVKDNAIVINNKTYPAVALSLPYAGVGNRPCFVIISDSPQ
jgi:hypothetical protein